MPAVDFFRYCTACDEARAALADAAPNEEERQAILREHPRRMATKTDIAGKPVCAHCLDSLAERRKASFHASSK
jgi:hypothetical protein